LKSGDSCFTADRFASNAPVDAPAKRPNRATMSAIIASYLRSKAAGRSPRPAEFDQPSGAPGVRANFRVLRYPKLLLSLSTGGVAVYFLGLTGKIEPRLTTSQIAAVSIATIGFADAGLSGISCWSADCRRNYFWASALQAEDKLERSKLYRQRDRWLRGERVTANLLISLFVLGVLVSALYIGLRLLGV
jgi:hypothetical protein